MERKSKVSVLSDRFDMGRIPPQDTDLEEVVLGALILEEKAIVDILPVLNEDVFYKDSHRTICKAILNLVNDNNPVDLLTVCQEVNRLGKLEEIGGAYAISQLTNRVASARNTGYHFRLLLQMFFRRQIIEISFSAARKAYEPSEDVFDVYEWITSRLEEIQIHIGAGKFLDTHSVIQDTIKMIRNEEDKVYYYPIGDKGIDNVLTISPGNLVNISAKSGAGKTSFIIYLAKELIQRYPDEIAICWYTMEDPTYKLLMAFIAPDVMLTHDQLLQKKGYKLSESEIDSVERALNKYLQYDIEFNDRPSFITHIKAHFTRFCNARPNKFCILILDNIMLLKDNEKHRFKNKQYEVDDHIAQQIQSLFTGLKNDFRISIWYLHHLTKEQLSKTNAAEGYRPREDNIRGSTRLRDMATQGIMINRPGEFIDINKFYRGTPLEGPMSDLMVLEAFKNRDGKVGFFRYFTNLDYKIFYSL